MLFQKIAIPLHHVAALVHIVGTVISGADFVVFNVGKLPFDGITVKALLVQRVLARLRKPCGVAVPL